MEHIVEFLRSMDEPEMADEVANAHNRLECYSTGITNEIIESLRSVAEKSLAELAALKGENEELRKDAEWRDIETAPKDGTVFLGYKRGQFRECYKVPRDDCDMWCFGGTSGADDLFPNIKPTHWMPLPKPPAMAQGDKP